MKDVFKPHEAARVKAGEFAGLVGTVREVLPGVAGGWAMVEIQGVKDGQAVDTLKKFRVTELERNHVR